MGLRLRRVPGVRIARARVAGLPLAVAVTPASTHPYLSAHQGTCLHARSSHKRKVILHSRGVPMMSRASARAIKDMHDRGQAAGVPHETQTTEHKGNKGVPHRSTGRNSKMGRKAEKPRDPKSGGPSGQPDRAKHDK